MKKHILLFLIAAFVVVSCGKDFTSLSPLSQRNVENFYNTQSDFEVAINGAYDALQMDGTYNNNYILMFEMRSDNSANNGGATGLAQAFERIDKFSELNDSGLLQTGWSASYEGIARTNKILAELEGADNLDAAFTDRIRGEALFIRSLLYYNLAVSFGNIPLQLDPISTPSNVTINQVSASEIYTQISGDLQSVVDNNLLPTSYSSDVGKATHYAAATLLGKVYLTMGQDGQAETALRIVENQFSLVPDYANLWGPDNENNQESIFEVQFKAGGLGEGSRFTDIFTPLGEAGGVGGGNAPQIPTDDVVNAFDQNNDERFDATFELNTDTPAIPDDYYVEKYASSPFGPFDADNNWPVFRYSEVLLMLAEAVGEGTEGYGYINQVRQRAGLGPIDGNTPGTYEEKLLRERRLEFAFENKRWKDLKRFGMAKQVMSAHLGLSESRITLLYPIPQQEISVAPDQMEQNSEHQ